MCIFPCTQIKSSCLLYQSIFGRHAQLHNFEMQFPSLFVNAIIFSHMKSIDVCNLNCDSVFMNRWFICISTLFVTAPYYSMLQPQWDCFLYQRIQNKIQKPFNAERCTHTLRPREYIKKAEIRLDYCFIGVSCNCRSLSDQHEQKNDVWMIFFIHLDVLKKQKRCLWRVLCETHWYRLNALFFMEYITQQAEWR